MRMLALAAFLAAGPVGVAAPVEAGLPLAEGVSMQHDLTPGVELPQVAFTGLDAEDGTIPDVSVSPTALTLRGEVILPLVDGELAAADLEGGVIPRLRNSAAALPAGRLTLQLDRRVPFRTLVRVIHTLHAAGHDRPAVLGRAGAHVMSAPIALAATAPRDQGGAQLVISLSGDELALWSRTGVEGTRARPRLRMHASSGIDLGALATTLAEIRARRGDGAILVMADGSVAMQRTLEVIGAVRATVDGAPLYPDVELASVD